MVRLFQATLRRTTVVARVGRTECSITIAANPTVENLPSINKVHPLSSHRALQIGTTIRTAATSTHSLLRSREGRAKVVGAALTTGAAIVPFPLLRAATVGLPAAAGVALKACRAASVMVPPAIDFVEKQLRKSFSRAARKRGGGTGNFGEHTTRLSRLLMRYRWRNPTSALSGRTNCRRAGPSILGSFARRLQTMLFLLDLDGTPVLLIKWKKPYSSRSFPL